MGNSKNDDPKYWILNKLRKLKKEFVEKAVISQINPFGLIPITPAQIDEYQLLLMRLSNATHSATLKKDSASVTHLWNVLLDMSKFIQASGFGASVVAHMQDVLERTIRMTEMEPFPLVGAVAALLDLLDYLYALSLMLEVLPQTKDSMIICIRNLADFLSELEYISERPGSNAGT
ncbi:hypothetical protein [Gorillibacterium massiliense]|uniref:hypothetical protein n=1 Tax=Gorillibacterium massiliense TaxID=1280390 RepID=UPI0004B8A46D|nr:hypothetical protein [Gorillibacterium massiliense]